MFSTGGGPGIPTSNGFSQLMGEEDSYPTLFQSNQRKRFKNNKLNHPIHSNIDFFNEQYDGPRYILITSLKEEKNEHGTDIMESSFLKTSPFKIQENIDNKFRRVDNVKKLRNEKLLVLVKNRKQGDEFLKTTRIGDLGLVKCEDHKGLNTSKGVIYCPDLIEETDEDILRRLKTQNVLEIYRIKKKNSNNEIIETPLIILTFDTPRQVKEIKLGYQVTEVREYIPNPKRCLKCQRFGHIQKLCKSVEVCSICLDEMHKKDNCHAPTPKCMNCNNIPPHQSSSRECPTFKEELEVQKIIVRTRKTYREAKTMRQSMAQENISYAKVTAQSEKPNNNIKDNTQTTIEVQNIIKPNQLIYNTSEKTNTKSVTQQPHSSTPRIITPINKNQTSTLLDQLIPHHNTIHQNNKINISKSSIVHQVNNPQQLNKNNEMEIDGEIIEKGTLFQSSEDHSTDENEETETDHTSKRKV